MKLFNKCCFLICAIVMLLSLAGVASASDAAFVTPSQDVPFALGDDSTPGINPLGSGSGYNQGTMTYNGKSYAYNVYIEATTGNGCRTGCYTEAACTREHGNVSVQFNTKNYGIVSASGGKCTCVVDVNDPSSFTTYSFWVLCPKGNSQIVSYVTASGTVAMTGTKPGSYAVRMW